MSGLGGVPGRLCLPKIHRSKPSPHNVTVFEERVFMGIIKTTRSSKGEVLINRISVFIGRDPRELSRVCSFSAPLGTKRSHVRTHKAAICSPRLGSSPDTNPASSLSWTYRKQICCLSHSACGILLWLPALMKTGRFRLGKCWKDPRRDPLLPPRGIFFPVVLFLCEFRFQKLEK